VTAPARTLLRAEPTLRQLELLVTRRLDGLLLGDHLGLVPGAGSEPAESRPYQPGDDVRRMDWNLTARSLEPHVRTTIAERELETWLVVDGSASLDFGTARCEKRDVALAAVACFAFLTGRAGNRVAAVIYGAGGAGNGTAPVVVPPRTGRQAIYALLHRLQDRPRVAPADDATSLGAALQRVGAAAKRRGLVVVVSDLLEGDTSWSRPLRAITVRHECVVVEVRDPRDAELPDVGLLTLVDPETGRRLEVQSARAKVRERFARAAAEQRVGIAAAVRRAGAAHLVLSTDRDWMRDVIAFVAQRRRRR
jgi:uncharacterized protein (DUF58 family)